jgi:hypothetical protein
MRVILAGAGAFGQKHLDAIKTIGNPGKARTERECGGGIGLLSHFE